MLSYRFRQNLSLKYIVTSKVKDNNYSLSGLKKMIQNNVKWESYSITLLSLAEFTFFTQMHPQGLWVTAIKIVCAKQNESFSFTT